MRRQKQSIPDSDKFTDGKKHFQLDMTIDRIETEQDTITDVLIHYMDGWMDYALNVRQPERSSTV